MGIRNDLEDYIKIYPNVLDKAFCLSVINYSEYRFEQTEILDVHLRPQKDTKIRNCLSCKPLSDEHDGVVFNAVGNTLQKYAEEVEAVLAGDKVTDSGYELLKYKEGGFYTQHTDDNREDSRRISISFLLNDDYDGGEFQFFGDLKVQGGTGSAIVFPSNFCYPHEILPVKSGIRYSIITWVF